MSIDGSKKREKAFGSETLAPVSSPIPSSSMLAAGATRTCWFLGFRFTNIEEGGFGGMAGRARVWADGVSVADPNAVSRFLLPSMDPRNL